MMRLRFFTACAVLGLAAIAFGTGPCSGDVSPMEAVAHLIAYKPGTKKPQTQKVDFPKLKLNMPQFFADSDLTFGTFGSPTLSGKAKRRGAKDFTVTIKDAAEIRAFCKTELEALAAKDGLSIQVDSASLAATATHTSDKQVFKLKGLFKVKGRFLNGARTDWKFNGTLSMSGKTTFIG